MADDFDKDHEKGGEDEARVLREEAAALERNARDLENIAHEEEERAHKLEDRAREIEEDREHGHHGGGGDDQDHNGHGHGGHNHDGHGHGDHDHDAKVKITMVVNGQPTVVVAAKSELLGDIRQKALEQTQNLAQPAESWEIKTEAGDLLDAGKKVGEYHFGLEVTLFLSLSAGVAGA